MLYWAGYNDKSRGRRMKWKTMEFQHHSWKFDNNFVNDISLISSTSLNMQRRLEWNAAYVVLKMSVQKTMVMRINTRSQERRKNHSTELEDTDEFTYLGSTMIKDGGAVVNIKRHSKARQGTPSTFLEKCGNTNHVDATQKLCIFQSNVLTFLLYGAELWRMTGSAQLKFNRFHCVCLKKITRILWPMTFSLAMEFSWSILSIHSEISQFLAQQNQSSVTALKNYTTLLTPMQANEWEQYCEREIRWRWIGPSHLKKRSAVT